MRLEIKFLRLMAPQAALFPQLKVVGGERASGRALKVRLHAVRRTESERECERKASPSGSRGRDPLVDAVRETGVEITVLHRVRPAADVP